MKILINAVQVLQILSALIMIGLILIQHGKGADMGSSFGSGSAGSLFGASGGANFLSRSTAICATVFFLCTLGLAYSGGAARLAPNGSSQSVLENPAQAPNQGADMPAVIPKAESVAPPAPSDSVPASGAVASEAKSAK
jgi:preprotein translocase subunit SecG